MYIVAILVVVLIFTAFLKSFTFKGEEKLYLPYYKRKYFLTKAEHEFFKILQQVVADKYFIVPQVQLSKLVGVDKYVSRNHTYLNKIDRKSVDFVLFDKEYFSPVMIIELDDGSHEREDRKIRDGFVDSICQKAEIPIKHIKTSYSYNILDLQENLTNH